MTAVQRAACRRCFKLLRSLGKAFNRSSRVLTLSVAQAGIIFSRVRTLTIWWPPDIKGSFESILPRSFFKSSFIVVFFQQQFVFQFFRSQFILVYYHLL